jgi:very-short-patch-repair endonuclease
MRTNQTDAEAVLWSELRDRKLMGMKFKRQMPIENYIVDFFCAEHRLIVEVDGTQHAENEYDRYRDAELAKHGFKVLRFWNDDVLREITSVCDTIVAVVRENAD